jgi:ABC-type bacteriocin/lantibiotic exporter with double-glycine peptidase domain
VPDSHLPKKQESNDIKGALRETARPIFQATFAKARNTMATSSSKTTSRVILGIGAVMCLWVGAAIMGALSQANWSVGELARQYMTATGMIKPLHTLVDFYTHIKGIEYLICVAFFAAFPAFYSYVSKEKKQISVQK